MKCHENQKYCKYFRLYYIIIVTIFYNWPSKLRLFDDISEEMQKDESK